jgi:hypothetical protein
MESKHKKKTKAQDSELRARNQQFQAAMLQQQIMDILGGKKNP